MSNSTYLMLKEEFYKKINPDVISNIEENNLFIEEGNKKATGKGIFIKNIFNALTMHLDESNRKIYFLKSETKINDATIFYINHKKLYVILIELKSKSLRKYKQQICYGKLYSDFIINVLKQDNPDIVFSKVEYRGYVFATGRNSQEIKSTKREIIAEEFRDGIYFKTFDNNKEYNFIELLLPIKFNEA
ncbi:MAG: hypothetical protein MJ191_05800 [Clostridium sp.]|nr:hypothetical protein [Clostridium sp.]